MEALRSFLYLDKQIVEDFLAAVTGGVQDNEKVVLTHETGGTLSGEGGVPLLKASGKTESKDKTEITKASVITDAARFQQLYAYLHGAEALRYYQTMTVDSWREVSRNDILELDVSLSFGKVRAMMNVVNEFANMANLVEQVTGQSLLDAQSSEAVKGFQALGELGDGKGVPVVMPLLGASDFKFVAHLSPTFLKVPKDQLNGEVTVLCKVQRKLEPSDKYELFNPFGSLANLPLNRKQRRGMPKLDMPPELRDAVKGPGAIVTAIAIYR